MPRILPVRLPRTLKKPGLALLLALLPVSATQAQQSADSATFEAVRRADLSFATVGFRLATANAALCDRLEPGLGIQLHSLDQFDAAAREPARAYFGFAAPIAIEGVVAGGPADQAGLRQDDSLLQVGTVDLSAIPGKPGTTDRLVAAQLAIAALPPAAPVEVRYLRGGVAGSVTVAPVPACRSRFELLLGSSYQASADGTMVKIGARFLEEYPEQEFAAVTAHEFAHNILHHREKLEARGVTWGLLSGFGGSVKYFRQTELQADLLSVYLLANAGYSPRASLAFWQRFGPSKAGGFLRSRSHPHWADRVETIEAEIARIDADPTRPLVPAMLADRNAPLTGDWQSLIVRAK